MAADNVGPMAPFWAIQTSDGRPMAEPAADVIEFLARQREKGGGDSEAPAPKPPEG